MRVREVVCVCVSKCACICDIRGVVRVGGAEQSILGGCARQAECLRAAARHLAQTKMLLTDSNRCQPTNPNLASQLVAPASASVVEESACVQGETTT